MGNTLTTNLSLNKPDGDEIARALVDDSLEDYLNENNTILRTAFGTTDLLSYTPQVYTTSSATTELSFGTGAEFGQASYRILHTNWVVGWWNVVLGTSPFSSGSTVTLHFTLPTELHSTFHSASTTQGAADVIGNCVVRDDSAPTNSGTGALQISSVTNRLFVISTNESITTRFFQNNSPLTWAAGDRISVNFFYRAPL